MAVKIINSANEAVQVIKEETAKAHGVPPSDMSESELVSLGIGNVIVLMSIVKRDVHKQESRRLFYKLHDLPPVDHYRSVGTYYAWIPYFKSNNSFVRPYPNIMEAVKYVFSSDVQTLDEVVICDTQEEMCEYILSKLRQPVASGV